MRSNSEIQMRVPIQIKNLLVAAANAKGEKETGLPGKLTPWAIEVLKRQALRELGYKSMTDWINSNPQYSEK